jgi:hypothetical protein
MELSLYHWNGNRTKLEKPTLQEILEFGQPFAITRPLKGGQMVPDEIVLGNWNCPWFSTWGGIRIHDYDSQKTYQLSEWEYKEGKKQFESKPGIITEWSLDKYRSRANWYEFQGQYPAEIFDEFKKLQFEFPAD